MKLFERHGGYWLFWTSAVYLVIAFYGAVYHKDIPAEVIQLVWLSVLGLPLYYPPLGRWLNMSIEWDRNMFDFFKKNKTPNNVVPFPEPKEVPKVPYVEPPEQEKPATTYYRIGLTDNHRVSFQMGYSEITMNGAGVDNLIKQLEVFRDQLQEEQDD